MILPLPSIWQSHDIENPGDRIDRHLADRTFRLSAGLNVSNDFKTISGSLLVTRGHGKFIRLQHACSVDTEVPDVIAQACHAATSEGTMAELAQSISDLADYQAMNVEEIKRQAGKYVDRMLAVTVCDPGGWSYDFDGKASYWPMCDATRLAELTGLNVIDAIPARDVASGGQGTQLASLPYWLLFADRDRKVASDSRAIISVAEDATGVFIPPSDGLDADLPALQSFDAPGARLLRDLVTRLLPEGVTCPSLERLNTDGQRIDSLILGWQKILNETPQYSHERNRRSIAKPTQPQPGSESVDQHEEMLVLAENFLAKNPESLSSVVRSAFVLISKRLVESLSLIATCDQVWIAADADVQAGLINQLTQLMPSCEVVSTDNMGVSGGKLSAVVAGLLGLMHIDQMPANVPWLSGSDGQRILGRLTPGRPTNWRHLILEMADFRPPAMKLKDAI